MSALSNETSKDEDFGIIAWHEDGRWNVSELTHVRDLGSIMDQLNSQATNGGAIALIAIEEDYFVVARALGSQMQMMISDVTYALESDLAADLLEMLDLPFPEEEDDSQPVYRPFADAARLDNRSSKGFRGPSNAFSTQPGWLFPW